MVSLQILFKIKHTFNFILKLYKNSKNYIINPPGWVFLFDSYRIFIYIIHGRKLCTYI
jgi:hypothetical protein